MADYHSVNASATPHPKARADIRTASLSEPVELVDYLYTRLKQLGVSSVHGVPGDYNLVALDSLEKNKLKWVGNCNELNAGYAADGYARVKGIAAIITTFGVGELSAANAIAGAFSEVVPVVHIVGTPSTISQRNGMLLHHTLGNGDFQVFANMSREISCAMAKLNDPVDAPALIDNALRECWLQSRPVYITLPTDMVQKKVEGLGLKTTLDLEEPDNEPEKEAYVLDVIYKYMTGAKKPMILVDACAVRHRVLDEVHELVTKTGLPTFVTPMSKGAINETLPNYGGVYAGAGSAPGIQEFVESSDLILSIGAIKSDFNTAGFSYRISQLSTIDFHSSHINVKYSGYAGVRMKPLFHKLIPKLDRNDLQVATVPKLDSNTVPPLAAGEDERMVSHDFFWPRLGKWLKEGDIVVTETGTANFGIWGTRFPPGVTAISQVLWGSIGYSVGATQGAALAAKEMGDKRRVILFVGDGSFQLTCQEISTMIRQGLTPIIFCICNEGYTIERFIHGMTASYNDVQNWRYKDLLAVFGADPKKSGVFQIRSRAALEELLLNHVFSSAQYIQFVELYMAKEDAPIALKLVTEASAKNNARLE
ncbi:MAG: Pyruvate decarboxylase 1 [Vezdaea aestivalis]|nr:MAG: Pyruvate decarboxylase 1 [Vezdaea aestivalis]